MEKVTPFALDALVALSHALALVLPVGRAVVFPREFALLACQSLAFLGEVKRIDSKPVGIVSAFQNSYIDADTLLWVLGFCRWFPFAFDAEDG